ncbi:universal stress protein [Agromyces humatus]|uniref:universal stress protein n=1 Tax=Agromyces humatus TaxID=279573 RepID=UPI001E60F78B|nr:universal stress protein [Agromyces humatus]
MAVIPSTSAGDGRASVVAGVDGSDASLGAVDLAASEAKRLGLPFEIIHVWLVPRSWSPLVGEYANDVNAYEKMHREVLNAALEYAQSIQSEPRGRLETGVASEVLAEVGRNAAVLVLASHSSGAFSRFLLGSVSHEVILDPPAPVLVVTPYVDQVEDLVFDDDDFEVDLGEVRPAE